jgi:predicted ATPase
MRRFVITGTPGAGKTAIIRQLELEGFSVVEEAATDVIAAAHAQGTVEPWRNPSFIDAIASLQRDRQIRASYKTGSSLFATLASSRPPKRGESPLRMRCVLRKSTKRLTGDSASN